MHAPADDRGAGLRIQNPHRHRSAFGFIRAAAVTSAAEADGRVLRRIVTTDNTSGDVWADSAYRSRSNETWLVAKMVKSQIHRRKPAGKPMPEATARANGKKSSIRARIEHGKRPA